MIDSIVIVFEHYNNLTEPRCTTHVYTHYEAYAQQTMLFFVCSPEWGFIFFLFSFQGTALHCYRSFMFDWTHHQFITKSILKSKPGTFLILPFYLLSFFSFALFLSCSFFPSNNPSSCLHQHSSTRYYCIRAFSSWNLSNSIQTHTYTHAYIHSAAYDFNVHLSLSLSSFHSWYVKQCYHSSTIHWMVHRNILVSEIVQIFMKIHNAHNARCAIVYLPSKIERKK